MEAEYAQALLLVDAELRRVGGAADVVVAARWRGDAGGVAGLGCRSAGDVAGHGDVKQIWPTARASIIAEGCLGVVMNVLIRVRSASPELAVSLSWEAVSVVHFYDVKCVKP